jgi:hypothetical protein
MKDDGRGTVGKRVRVWDMQRGRVFVEGKVIGIIPAPVIIVEDDDGARHYHSTELPIETQRVEWDQA